MTEDLSNPLRRDSLEAFAAHLAVLIESDETALAGRDTRVQAASHRLQRALLDDVKVAARRLDRVMTQLVTLSRLQAGLIAPGTEVIDAPDFLNEVVAEADSIADRVVVDCEAFTFTSDAALLHTALSNLLQNAARYSPVGTEIRLRAREAEGAVEFCVEDRGPGIAADQREKLFERFQRGTECADGMGLGLAIAKEFVTALSGTISGDERTRSED